MLNRKWGVTVCEVATSGWAGPEQTDVHQVTEPHHRSFDVSFGNFSGSGGWDKEKSYGNPNRLKNGRIGGSNRRKG